MKSTFEEKIGFGAYPLLEALRKRRSRRFCRGMSMNSGPFAYKSRFAPAPLSAEEEAAMAYAACGITGYALADLCYSRGEGGNIMAGHAGRTMASGDSIQSVGLIMTNDSGTFYYKRPQEFASTEIPKLIELGKSNDLRAWAEAARIKIKESRCAPPTEPIFNINANQWSAYAPGTSYFLPVNEVTFMYINGLLDVFNESSGAFVLDERANFRPAGLARFSKSNGGHLDDDPKNGKIATVAIVERLVTEFTSIEQGMMLQNLGLMSQALGLAGFPSFANHEFSWFKALGFRLGKMRASEYLGAGALAKLGMKMTRADIEVPFPLALEWNGQTLLKPYTPPYYPDMTAAVLAVVEHKFGKDGIFGQKTFNPSWSQNPSAPIPEPSVANIEAVCAYCNYIWKTYGRFPAYLAPLRTVAGFQAGHVDAEFYDKFFVPQAMSETQRTDFASEALKGLGRRS